MKKRIANFLLMAVILITVISVSAVTASATLLEHGTDWQGTHDSIPLLRGSSSDDNSNDNEQEEQNEDAQRQKGAASYKVILPMAHTILGIDSAPCVIEEGTTVTVNETLKFGSYFDFTLNGVLNGTVCNFCSYPIIPGQVQITVGAHGYMDLTCSDSSVADQLFAFLEAVGISPKRVENHICAGNFPPCLLGHTWDDNGKCTVCEEECAHEWKNCKCTVCGVIDENGEHDWSNGKCAVCGKVCANEFHIGEYICPDCGMSFNASPTGSVISEGNLTVIVGVAAAVIFGLGGFILGTKKKEPTLADGTENTDEE